MFYWRWKVNCLETDLVRRSFVRFRLVTLCDGTLLISHLNQHILLHLIIFYILTIFQVHRPFSLGHFCVILILTGALFHEIAYINIIDMITLYEGNEEYFAGRKKKIQPFKYYRKYFHYQPSKTWEMWGKWKYCVTSLRRSMPFLEFSNAEQILSTFILLSSSAPKGFHNWI